MSAITIAVVSSAGVATDFMRSPDLGGRRLVRVGAGVFTAARTTDRSSGFPAGHGHVRRVEGAICRLVAVVVAAGGIAIGVHRPPFNHPPRRAPAGRMQKKLTRNGMVSIPTPLR